MSEIIIDLSSGVNDKTLRAIAHTSTRSLDASVHPDFWSGMEDRDYMRIGYFLALKSYEEGGCPIGGVIVDNQSGQILGKGHNTLVQDNDPYNHGETAAIRDAGRIDFSKTTIFTTLSPCDVCATLVYMRGFSRIVIGDVTSASGNEELLKHKGVKVDILEDHDMIELYGRYRQEKPDLDLEDWRGLAAVSKVDEK